MISCCYPASKDERSNRGTKLHSSHAEKSNAMCSSNTKSYAHRLHHHMPEIPTPRVMIHNNSQGLTHRKF
ncbi:unnamed protein product [Prunus armeniaca]